MLDFQIPPNATRTRTCIIYRDRFLRFIFTERAEVQLEDARDCIAASRVLFGSGPALPIHVDLRRLRSLSGEARAYLAQPDDIPITPAIALMVASPLSRAIGNFFLGFNRPPAPTRLFTEFTSAETWLEAFLPVERVA